MQITVNSKPQSVLSAKKWDNSSFKKKTTENKTYLLDKNDLDDENVIHTIYKMNKTKTDAIIVNPKLNGISIPMEVDTGASLSVVSKSVFDNLQQGDKQLKLEESNVTFKTYTGESIKAVGKVKITVEYENNKEFLTLYVVEGNKPSLLGRDWLYEIQLNWGNIFTIKKDNQRMLNDLLTEFEEIFGSDLGLLKGEKAKIHLKENAQPKFCKARPIPYAQKQKS